MKKAQLLVALEKFGCGSNRMPVATALTEGVIPYWACPVAACWCVGDCRWALAYRRDWRLAMSARSKRVHLGLCGRCLRASSAFQGPYELKKIKFPSFCLVFDSQISYHELSAPLHIPSSHASPDLQSSNSPPLLQNPPSSDFIASSAMEFILPVCSLIPLLVSFAEPMTCVAAIATTAKTTTSMISISADS